MYLFALSKGLSEPTQALLRNSWRAMGRSPELDYKLYAENTIGATTIAESEGYARTLAEYSRFVHEANKTDFWRDGSSGRPQHNQPFETLDDGMKVNYAVLLQTDKSGLSLVSDKSNEKFFIDLSTKEINLNNWLRKNEAERASNEAFTQNTVEWFVLHNLKPTFKLKGDNPELMWNDTTVAAIQAIHETISNLHEAKDENKFRSICQRLHELMINNNLWGNDSENSDRTKTDMTDDIIFGFNDPKPFDELPIYLKENYVLIVLSALSGMTQYIRDSKKS